MRWALGSVRVWLALGAAVAATLLASRDDRTGWTVVVGAVTAALAVAAIAVAYADAHPDRAEVRAARQQARVDEIVARYERGLAGRRGRSEDRT